MGRQSACRGTYLKNPTRDCERNPGGERVLCQFFGVQRAARGWGRSENCVLERGFFPGGGKLSGHSIALTAASRRGATTPIGLKLPGHQPCRRKTGECDDWENREAN